MGSRSRKCLTYNEYTVAIICPLEVEVSAARYMLDDEHARLQNKDGDPNKYILGEMSGHNVAIGFLPHGSQGKATAATVAAHMNRTFSSIRLRLLVGIGGGIPSEKKDIRLGDVVVGVPVGVHGGVVEYDLGKETSHGFERKGYLCMPPDEWRSAIVEMQSDHRVHPNRTSKFLLEMLSKYPTLVEYCRPAPEKDVLFSSSNVHVENEPTCDKCDKNNVIAPRRTTGPKIFYGTIASGDKVIKNATVRDTISRSVDGAICFEMEAAGLTTHFPCIVIRGICDYADSHKNDDWHAYAAGVAAACAKELLTYMEPVTDAQPFFDHARSTSSVWSHPMSFLPVNDAPEYLLSSHFTGRDEELKLISDGFKLGQPDIPTRCAVYGMSGLGKTQLILKYAKQCFDQGRYSFIFFVSASSIEKLNQGFTKILHLVDHPDRYHPDQSVCLTMARRWLETCLDGHATWLLLVDNVEKATLKFLRELLPRRNPKGRILLTTRGEDIATALVSTSNPHDHVLDLQVPNIKDAAVLFLKEAGKKLNPEETLTSQQAESLAHSVGRLPLAVSNAAAFMNKSHASLSDMVGLYRSSQKMELLNWQNNLSLHEEESVAAGFKAQFNQLEKKFPESSNLLKLLSFFDTERIRIDVIKDGLREWTATRSSSNEIVTTNIKAEKLSLANLMIRNIKPPRNNRTHDRDARKDETRNTVPQILDSLSTLILSPFLLQDALQQIEDLSLVTCLHGSHGLELHMHDLIKFMVQEMNMDVDCKTTLFGFASSIVCNAFRLVEDRTSPKSWWQCELIVPHVESLRKLISSSQNHDPDLAWPNVEVGAYFQSRGRYAEAASLYREVLSRQQAKSRLNQPETNRALRGLVTVLTKQGLYNEAENLCKGALGSVEMPREEASMEALTISQELVNVYDKQGRYAEALNLGERVLSGLKRKVGDNHPDTLQIMHAIGLACGHQAQYDRAERLFKHILHVQEVEKTWGPDHPDTLRTVNALANLYDRRRQYESAVELYNRAIKGRETLFGINHPQTLRSVCGLANLYMRKGLFEESKSLYSRALEASEKYFQIENPDILRAAHGLASVLSCQREYFDAEKQYERVICGRTAVLGQGHADTLRSMEGLAIVYIEVGQYGKAEELYKKVLAGRKESLGAEHPETLQTVRNLAFLGKRQRQHSATIGN